MQDNWYEAAVSFTGPHRIVSVVDWASDAPDSYPTVLPGTYNVFPWGINDPSVANRSMVEEPFDTLASPIGWHAVSLANDPQSDSIRGNNKTGLFRNTTTTWGNNVFAHENWSGRNVWVDNYRPDGGAEKIFNFSYDPKWTNSSQESLDEAKKYIDAVVTQLFYTSNLVHDLFYR